MTSIGRFTLFLFKSQADRIGQEVYAGNEQASSSIQKSVVYLLAFSIIKTVPNGGFFRCLFVPENPCWPQQHPLPQNALFCLALFCINGNSDLATKAAHSDALNCNVNFTAWGLSIQAVFSQEKVHLQSEEIQAKNDRLNQYIPMYRVCFCSLPSVKQNPTTRRHLSVMIGGKSNNKGTIIQSLLWLR